MQFEFSVSTFLKKSLLCLGFLTYLLFSPVANASQEDIKTIIESASQKKWQDITNILAKNKNAEVQLLGKWLCYRNHNCAASFEEVNDFIQKTYYHLDRGNIIESAELILVRENNTKEAIKWFGDHFPSTYEGLQFYLKAIKVELGQQAYDKRIKEFWQSQKLTSQFQRKYYRDHKDQLSQEDHIARFNFLIHEQKYIMAERIASLVEGRERKLVNAKVALARNHPRIAHLINETPEDLRNDPTLNYLRLKWRRKKNLTKGAFELIESNNVKFPQNADMWRERDYFARLYFSKNQYDKAYRFVSEHGLTEGSAFAEAEFLSGWIALKHLGDVDKAIKHFGKLQANTSTPMSQSRAHYWLGAAYQMKQDTNTAKKYFAQAAKYPTTYYGQVACKKVGCRIQSFLINQMGIPQRKVNDFNSDERVKLAKSLSIINPQLSRKVTESLSHSATDRDTHFLVSELSMSLGFIDLATRISRHAVNKNMGVFSNAYPLIQESLSIDNQNHALAHAIMRQESNFKAKAVSPVGARGIAQIMPATARMMARKNNMPYSLQKLTADPVYNMRIGGHYINHLLAKYDGSKVLTLAAYNAGPQRVSRWIKENGDPRTNAVSEIDWIEKITLNETRNYVQRVLENSQVYQLKLSNDNLKNRMVTVNDLN